MPELLLLSLPTEQVEDLHKASADPATAEIWRSLWREQHPAATATVCFSCDQPVPFPPVGLILPDYDTPSHKLIVPICTNCGARPTMQKYGRALNLLRQMTMRGRVGG
jgi:hypothetical protein